MFGCVLFPDATGDRLLLVTSMSIAVVIVVLSFKLLTLCLPTQGTTLLGCTSLACPTGTQPRGIPGAPQSMVSCTATSARHVTALHATHQLEAASTLCRFGCGPGYRLAVRRLFLRVPGSMWSAVVFDPRLLTYGTRSAHTGLGLTARMSSSRMS